MSKKTLVFMILSLLWMGVIFSFSAKEAAASSKESSGIAQSLFEIFYPESGGMYETEIKETMETIEIVVRKTAHVMEYMVLGILIYFSIPALSVKRRALLAMAISIIYAASDEIHQLFVPGRSGQVTDVLVDSIGIVIGVAIGLGISRIARGTYHQNKSQITPL